MRYWEDKDQILTACACLAGCKADSGMVNTFNKMEKEGEFEGCRTIGQHFRRWLAYLIAGEDVNYHHHKEEASQSETPRREAGA
jgi:hypothetical protein